MSREENTTMLSNGYSLTPSILSEIQIPQKGILSHTLYNDEQAKIILLGFAAGEELTSHTAPMPATIQILSGEVTLTLGPDICEAAPGCFVCSSQSIGIDHGQRVILALAVGVDDLQHTSALARIG
jgi:hypothetical protein